MNKKIILTAVAFAFGLGFFGAALRPVHAPVAKTIVLPDMVIAADPPATTTASAPVETAVPVAKATTAKKVRTSRKTAKNDSAPVEMLHVVGLPHPVVDQIHPSKPEHLVFENDVQL